MMIRFLAILALLFGGVASFGGSAWAQLSQLEATRIAETILSNQNPLVVIEEISHDGLVITPKGNGYNVLVQGPKFPSHDAFAPSIEFTMTPVDGDLVQVQITQLAGASETESGGNLTFRPSVFQGLFSRADRGFQSLQFGMSNMAYVNAENSFGIDRFETNLTRKEGRYELKIAGLGFKANFQDVMDFDESAAAFNLIFAIDERNGNGGDLLFVANRVFELMLDPGNEDTNTLGKERPLPADLQGLSLEVSVQGLESGWLALRNETNRETIADVLIDSIFIRGGVIDAGNGLSSMQINFGVNGMKVKTPDSLVSAEAEIFALNIDMAGIDSKLLPELFAKGEGAQTTALSKLVGQMQALEVVALGKAIDVNSPDLDAFITLSQGDFRVALDAPYNGAPNFKDVTVEIDIHDLQGDYPEAVEAIEPAWTSMVEPALPSVLEMRLAAKAIPSDIWKGVASIILDAKQFPQDTSVPNVITSVSLDGTTYGSKLVNALVGGTLTLNPDAPLFAVGELSLELDNLRPLIGAMQRSARVPNRTLAQFLTLGSVGLATISGYAERTDRNTQLFVFDFVEDGMPTINGRPLPAGF